MILKHPNDFTNHREALAEADKRAAITLRRYRVKKDRANLIWAITETIQPITVPWKGRCEG